MPLIENEEETKEGDLSTPKLIFIFFLGGGGGGGHIYPLLRGCYSVHLRYLKIK